MQTFNFTTAEFAAEFPRARAHDAAIRYVAVHSHPDTIVKPSQIEVQDGEAAVQVGYTNKSRSKKITRFAIVPAEAVESA